MSEGGKERDLDAALFKKENAMARLIFLTICLSVLWYIKAQILMPDIAAGQLGPFSSAAFFSWFAIAFPAKHNNNIILQMVGWCKQLPRPCAKFCAIIQPSFLPCLPPICVIFSYNLFLAS